MWSPRAPARWTGQPSSPPSAGNRSEAGLSSNAGPAGAGCVALSVPGRLSAASTSSSVRWHEKNQTTSHRRGRLQCAEHRGDLRPEGTQALVLTLLGASPSQAWAVSFYLPLLSTWKTGAYLTKGHPSFPILKGPRNGKCHIAISGQTKHTKAELENCFLKSAPDDHWETPLGPTH